MAPLLTYCALAFMALGSIHAHPGHNVAEEAAERAEFFRLKPRTLRDCATHLDRRGIVKASIQRRQELAKTLRAKRGLTDRPMIHRRDFSSYNFSHASTESMSMGVDETLLFADNSSCTLQSEVTQGPYYVTGELIRHDVTEDQDGVPVYLDVQIIDTSSCEPVPAVYMDLWHCNSTGVYSGVIANGNGDQDDSTNINNTFLRGIQQTNQNGIVQFETLFPGHYDGRATHIHILTHAVSNTTVLVNGTLLSSTYNNTSTHASHVGQLFFDQYLITEVEKTYPYNTNNATTTLNSEDSILSEEADTTDPFVEYVLLGDTVEDGILAWISIGIDPTADNEINSAATKYASGGVANENSMGGGSGSGAPSGNGTMGAAAPNGTMSGTNPSGSSMSA